MFPQAVVDFYAANQELLWLTTVFADLTCTVLLYRLFGKELRYYRADLEALTERYVRPYFFAMLVALNLQTSFLTPPMAMSAYYLKGVLRNEIELIEIFKGIMPYLGIVIFAMVLMYQFPGIALWLPDYLFGVWVP